ncbi:MAG: EamA family transporter [Halioglobus sp.]|nr:EamA family transporter [Halioglobus sp.]
MLHFVRCPVKPSSVLRFASWNVVLTQPWTMDVNNTLLYVVTVLIWGTTWIAIEFQLGVVPAEVSVFYRYLLAASLLFAWCLYSRKPVRFGASAHLRFMLLGLLMFSLNYMLTYHAQIYVTSALAAIAFSTMLWMNMINARLFFGVRSDWRAIGGSLLGVAGIVVIFYPQIDALTLSDATFYGMLLVLLGALLASFGNMVSQDAQSRGLPILQSNAWGMAYGALFTGLIAFVSDAAFIVDTRPAYLVSLLYLAVFGSIVAFGAYLTLLGRIGAHKAGYATVMFPVVALAISVLFEGLLVSKSLMAGVLLVLAGNVFVLQAKKAPPVDTGEGPLAAVVAGPPEPPLA